MAGRGPDRHDTYQGWKHVAHTDQKSSSTSAEYNPKGSAKKANFGEQPGTPSIEKRWEADMEFYLSGDRRKATGGERDRC
jgi:hypothetical protein